MAGLRPPALPRSKGMEPTTRTADGLRCPLCHGALGGEGLRECVGCGTPFHRGCWRELGGCSTLGCPEAGRPASSTASTSSAAAKEGAPAPRRFAANAVAIVGVLLAWPAAMVASLPALVLVALAVLPHALARRRRAALTTLALSPAVLPLVSALFAVGGYLLGTASFLTVGLMGGPAPVDRVVRCAWRSTGCITSGLDELWSLPNNLTLRALGAVFGPMRGAYDGPWPTDEIIADALARPDAIVSFEHGPELEDHLEDVRVVVGGREVLLPSRSLYMVTWCGRRQEGGRLRPLRAAPIDERALVVADEHGDGTRCAVVIDARTGAVITSSLER